MVSEWCVLDGTNFLPYNARLICGSERRHSHVQRLCQVRWRCSYGLTSRGADWSRDRKCLLESYGRRRLTWQSFNQELHLHLAVTNTADIHLAAENVLRLPLRVDHLSVAQGELKFLINSRNLHQHFTYRASDDDGLPTAIVSENVNVVG